MKTIVLAFFACVATIAVCPAAPIDHSLARAPLLRVDWQEPQSLPPRFRNHCVYDRFSGRPYCSDHCGFADQFYYCAPRSFGCCRVGFGYCDWNGLLRCAP